MPTIDWSIERTNEGGGGCDQWQDLINNRGGERNVDESSDRIITQLRERDTAKVLLIALEQRSLNATDSINTNLDFVFSSAAAFVFEFSGCYLSIAAIDIRITLLLIHPAQYYRYIITRLSFGPFWHGTKS